MRTRLALLLLLSCYSVNAWISPARHEIHRNNKSHFRLDALSHDGKAPDELLLMQDSARRGVLMSSLLSITTLSAPAFALVKGNSPPLSKKPLSERPKCTNVEECQAMAEQKALEEDAMPKGPPPKVTKKGTRYIDLDEGNASLGTVKNGDEVTLYYKVLKLGKRSYDGLSGEGTVVFSRGYGLEDDENAPGSKSFKTLVGSSANIEALNDGVVGMNVGGIRRFSVMPQQGWERPTAQCDGGPGGRGAGGDLKTDYVIVPTATMVATEECFDKTKLPFPSNYAQERRMAQRFDQSLIMEVQVVGIQS